MVLKNSSKKFKSRIFWGWAELPCHKIDTFVMCNLSHKYLPLQITLRKIRSTLLVIMSYVILKHMLSSTKNSSCSAYHILSETANVWMLLYISIRMLLNINLVCGLNASNILSENYTNTRTLVKKLSKLSEKWKVVIPHGTPRRSCHNS